MSDKANAAFEQAAAKVVERASQTGTPIVVWQDYDEKQPEDRREQNQKTSSPIRTLFPDTQADGFNGEF